MNSSNSAEIRIEPTGRNLPASRLRDEIRESIATDLANKIDTSPLRLGRRYLYGLGWDHDQAAWDVMYEMVREFLPRRPPV